MPDRLVICLDGTWNSTFNEVEREDGTKVLKPTNTLKIARSVLPRDDAGDRQITLYDSGVGALGQYPGVSNRMLHFFDRKLGGGFGAGFEANVEQAANFLALNFREGTDVFVFGFSRGAAQARALTRFLSWLGGIPAKNDAYYVPVFFRQYLAMQGKGQPDIRTRSGDTPAERLLPFGIRFLGVWDTVMALGSRIRASANTSMTDRAFHIGSQPAACVRHARQALAIDEQRYDFQPEIWRDHLPDQTLEQRWFPGVHANVGGSQGNDGLANNALHWMVDEAKAHGLAVDHKFLWKYAPFAQDALIDSHSLFYKTTEALRFKRGRGARAIEGYPPSARLRIDPSVIRRLCSDPADFEEMSDPYRPQSLVDFIVQHRANWPEFLRNLGMEPADFPFPDDL